MVLTQLGYRQPTPMAWPSEPWTPGNTSLKVGRQSAWVCGLGAWPETMAR